MRFLRLWGLFLVVASVLGMVGVSYMAVANPAIVIPLGAIALLLPGGLNVRALWLNPSATGAGAVTNDG